MYKKELVVFQNHGVYWEVFPCLPKIKKKNEYIFYGNTNCCAGHVLFGRHPGGD